MSNGSRVLVTGATGTQGGMVVRRLLASRWRVRVLVRDDASEPARQLERLGAEIHRGDLLDADSVSGAVNGCCATYLVTVPTSGEEAEVAAATNVTDAARRAGAHVVFASIANADRNLSVPYVGWKHRIERLLASSGVKHTILAPTYFMENLLAPWVQSELSRGRLVQMLPPGTPVMQVAVADLAHLACLVLKQPQRFAGERIDVGGQLVTGDEIARTLEREMGRSTPLQRVVVPESVVRSDPTMGQSAAAMIRWLDSDGFAVDLPALHRRFPQVAWQSFDDWASQHAWGGAV